MALTEAHVSALLDGVLKPEDYFELILETLGTEKTQVEFLDMIEVLLNLDEDIHSALTVIYLEFFSKALTNELTKQEPQQQQQQQLLSKRRYKESEFYEERYNSDLSSIGFKNVISDGGAANHGFGYQDDNDDDDNDYDSVYIISDDDDDDDDMEEEADDASKAIPTESSPNLPANEPAGHRGVTAAVKGQVRGEEKAKKAHLLAGGAGNWIGGSLVRKSKARGKERQFTSDSMLGMGGRRVGEEEDLVQDEDDLPASYAIRNGMNFRAAASKPRKGANAGKFISFAMTPWIHWW